MPAGGHLELGESFEACAQREVRQGRAFGLGVGELELCGRELSLEADTGRTLGVYRLRTGDSLQIECSQSSAINPGDRACVNGSSTCLKHSPQISRAGCVVLFVLEVQFLGFRCSTKVKVNVHLGRQLAVSSRVQA